MSTEAIAYETPHEIAFHFIPEVIEAFNARKMFFGRDTGVFDGSIVIFPKTITVEPYTNFPRRHLFDCGAFSYSETATSMARIKVGRFCSIAHGLEVFGARHPVDRVTTSSITYDYLGPDGYLSFKAAHRDLLDDAYRPNIPPNVEQPFPIVENDVWVGQNVQLARGIRLGTGCIVAAGSVVTRDVAPYTIVGGVPARVIRQRFPIELSQGLLESEWWTYHPEDLFEIGLEDPVHFLDRFRNAESLGRLSRYVPERMTWMSVTDVVSPRSILEMNASMTDRSILANGWSTPEQTFTWALGTSGTLVLAPNLIASRTVIELDLVANPIRPQRVVVSVRSNAAPIAIASVTIVRETTISISIEPPMVTADGIVIDIVHPDHIRPVDAGINDDTRELSIAIQRITLR